MSENNAPKSKVDIWIIDDSQHYCWLTTMVLQESDRIGRITSYHTSESALKDLTRGTKPPDVILLDIYMPGMTGLELLPLLKVRAPETKVIVLTAFEFSENVLKALKLGASGYLLKSATAADITRAIEVALENGMPLDPFVVQKVIAMSSLVDTKVIDYDLTVREKEILKHLVDGLSMQSIADKISVSYTTINTHVKSIHEKLKVHCRSELIAKVMKEKLV
jgi:DNA-binding NarL/FixJ family response regulator